MPYRKRIRGSHKFNERMARARAARERLRLEGPVPEYRPELPMIRRRIIVEDYDCGGIVWHEFTLARCGRVDCYHVSVDGKTLPGRVGWSRVLELVRKAFIRVSFFD